MDNECCRNFIVAMGFGLPARPVAFLVRTAHMFQAEMRHLRSRAFDIGRLWPCGDALGAPVG